MKNKDILFKIFLIIYIGFLSFHALEMDWNVVTISGVLIGLFIAFASHLKHGNAAILLLIVHMLVEWIHHAKSGFNYSSKELVFEGVHSILDFILLYQESKLHLRKWLYQIFFGVFLIIGAVIIFTPKEIHEEEHLHGESSFPFEAVVTGGILGCALSHLISKKHTHG
jgi:hypothetical protein